MLKVPADTMRYTAGKLGINLLGSSCFYLVKIEEESEEINAIKYKI